MEAAAASIELERDRETIPERSSSTRPPSPTSFFEDSLYSLFSHNQPAHGDPGDVCTYSHPNLPLRTTAERASRQQTGIQYGITKNNAVNNRLFAHFQWDAGLYLADMIAEQSFGSKGKRKAAKVGENQDNASFADVRGKSVVELGAGTGLPGLVACLMGADRVVLTDYPDQLILENLRRNVDFAMPPSLPAVHLSEVPNTSDNSARPRIHVHGLEWGNAEQEAKVLSATEQRQGFDIVLAADVLWISSAHSSLIQSIRTLLRHCATARCILVAGFHTGRPAVRRFFVELAQAGATQGGIVPDWETKHGGIWQRHVDGTERPLTPGWVPVKTSLPTTFTSSTIEEDMGDISDRSSWVVIASLRWANL